MDAKDKALVMKTKPEDWKLGDLKAFWGRQVDPDMARQCEFHIGRLSAMQRLLSLETEKQVSIQFLGDIYNNPTISRQPVKKGDILVVPESQVKYLMGAFPGQWQKVKVVSDSNETEEETSLKLRRGGSQS